MNISNGTGYANASSSEEAMFRSFKLSMYSFVLLLSVTGNVILICAIVKFRSLRTVPNFLVLNLSCCDLLLVLTSIPFQVAYEELGYFPFGPVACKILWPLATCAINAGVLTLVAIAVERFKAINSPMTFRFDKSRAFVTIFAIHVVGIGTVIPYSFGLRFSTSDGYPDCVEIWDRKSRQSYTVALFLIQYAIPLPVIVTLYSLAWNKVRRQNLETIKIAQRDSIKKRKEKQKETKREEKNRNLVRRDSSIGKRISEIKESFRKPSPLCEIAVQRYEQTMRTLRMFIAVIVVFAVCALPNQITWLWTDFSNKGGPSNMVTAIFYFLTYTNCVLNPWIYGGFNLSFRKAYKRMLYDRGILRIFRILSCSKDFGKKEALLNSKTEVSGVCKAKQRPGSCENDFHMQEGINQFSEEANGHLRQTWNIASGSPVEEPQRNSYSSDYSKTFADQGDRYDDSLNWEDSQGSTYINDVTQNGVMKGETGYVLAAKICIPKPENVDDVGITLNCDLPLQQASSVEINRPDSASSSGISSNGSIRHGKRQVTFFDPRDSYQSSLIENFYIARNSRPLDLDSYSDVPYSVDIDTLSSLRETDC